MGARADHGGFAISSTEHCVKQATGWARYSLAAEPESEVVLEIVEEANYEEPLQMSEEGITTFLTARAPSLQQDGIVSSSGVDDLQRIREGLSLGGHLRALISPLSIAEEQLIFWKNRKWTYVEEGVKDTVAALLDQGGKLKQLESEEAELHRKQTLDSGRIQKIFENQSRLRENIKSLEQVRSGTLLDRYMNDMDKEENELIQTRRRLEEAEEALAKLGQDSSHLTLQISMKAKEALKQSQVNRN